MRDCSQVTPSGTGVRKRVPRVVDPDLSKRKNLSGPHELAESNDVFEANHTVHNSDMTWTKAFHKGDSSQSRETGDPLTADPSRASRSGATSSQAPESPRHESKFTAKSSFFF